MTSYNLFWTNPIPKVSELFTFWVTIQTTTTLMKGNLEMMSKISMISNPTSGDLLERQIYNHGK